MGDLKWLRQNGLEAVITRMAGKGIPVIGVCGGFQMLGTSLSDPHGVEEGGTMRGMELLPIRTIFAEKKTRTRVNGTAAGFSNDGVPVKINGYEIHMGETIRDGGQPFSWIQYENGENIAAMAMDSDARSGYKTAVSAETYSEPMSTEYSTQKRCSMRSAISSQREKVFVRRHMKTGKHSRWQSIKKSSMTRWLRLSGKIWIWI